MIKAFFFGHLQIEIVYLIRGTMKREIRHHKTVLTVLQCIIH